MIGSKPAARGDAIEAYYNLPLIDEALTFQIRYTRIKYDYTGSMTSLWRHHLTHVRSNPPLLLWHRMACCNRHRPNAWRF